MARKNNLAALAALAGAAYLYNKDKDKTKDADFQKNREDQTSKLVRDSRAARPEDTKTSEDKGSTADKETKRKILETITTPKEKSNDAAGNQGVIDSNSSSVEKPDAKSVTNVKNANTTPAKPVVKRQDRTTMYGTKSGVMGGATLPSASASPDPVKRTRKEAQAVIDQHKIDAKAERSKRLASQMGAKPYTPVKPNLATSSSGADIAAVADPDAAKAQYSRSMADQMRAKRDAENAKKITDMQRKTESFANPQPDMEDQIRNTMGSTMRRGGAVKMASGGSVSASRRGDGIAQRGKTRGKMC